MDDPVEGDSNARRSFEASLFRPKPENLGTLLPPGSNPAAVPAFNFNFAPASGYSILGRHFSSKKVEKALLYADIALAALGFYLIMYR